jgi:predicted permease
MSRFRSLLVRLRAVVQRSSLDHDLDDELRYHLEKDVERLVAAGMSPRDAATTARRAFGNVTHAKEEARDAYAIRVIDLLTRDLTFAGRLARKHPAFSAVIVLSLALGLGSVITVFSLTYNVLFAPLPLPNPGELVALTRVSKADRDLAFSVNDVRALRSAFPKSTLTAVRGASQIAVEHANAREFINLTFIDGDYFSVLRLMPLRGRAITRDDDARGAAVAVLSQPFAQLLFGSDSAALDQNISIRGIAYTIVGITPRAFRGVDFPGQFTVAVPMSTVPYIARAGDRGDDRGVSLAAAGDDQRMLKVIARLSEQRQAAEAALTASFDRCCAAATNAGPQHLELLDISRGLPNGKDDFRGTAGAVFTMLLGGMVVLLAVVCCNLASLLIVRTTARQREVAVRLSLGASRRRVVNQLILETLPLAILGGALGLVVAKWATIALLNAIPEADAYVDLARFRLEPVVLLFSTAATLVAAVAFSAYPAFRGTRQRVSEALRSGSHASRPRREGAIARGVVTIQVALTVVLVTTGGLLAVTLRNLSRADGGFAVNHVLLVSLEARGTTYEHGGVGPIHEDILNAVRRVPSTSDAAFASMLPMFGGNMGWAELDIPGYEPPARQHALAQINAITPRYFATLGGSVRAGRDFTNADRLPGQTVAIISAAFAQRFFGSANPVGRTIRATIRGDSLVPMQIVGVAGDMKYADLRDTPPLLLYVPVAQTTEVWNALLVATRVEGDLSAATAAVTHAISDAAPGLRVRRVSDMRARVDVALAIQRLATQLAAFASAMVLVLSVIGLYGVVAHTVARRTSELGVRRALGATRRSIVWLVLREVFRVLAIGGTLGLMLSFLASSALRSQLFGVGTHDPIVFGASIALLALVSALASAAPALRAARTNPRVALTAE